MMQKKNQAEFYSVSVEFIPLQRIPERFPVRQEECSESEA